MDGPRAFCSVRDMSDPFDLQRFLDAQEPVYLRVIAELRAGRKQSHWMWFIFPQIEGLGVSAMTQKYAISSRAEAEAYLAHPVLGPRLRECAQLVASAKGSNITAIMGSPDDMKLKSSMTLFARATDDKAPFVAVLDRYYDGEEDSATIARL